MRNETNQIKPEPNIDDVSPVEQFLAIEREWEAVEHALCNQHMTISPYPESVRIVNIADGSQVFDGKRFVGEVHKHNADGVKWLARPSHDRLSLNRWHNNKTDAVKYLLTVPMP